MKAVLLSEGRSLSEDGLMGARQQTRETPTAKRQSGRAAERLIRKLSVAQGCSVVSRDELSAVPETDAARVVRALVSTQDTMMRFARFLGLADRRGQLGFPTLRRLHPPVYSPVY
eukprot:6202651-Pleurochrysis_carterae.AAC.3